MQHDILQIKGCRSIAKYLCNSLDGITKHVYIYIYHYIYVYIYQQGHVATLHIKLPHQFAGSGRGKVAFKPDRRMGQAWAAYYFHCHFGLIHCSCERDRTGSVDSTDELVQIFYKLRLTCLQTKSHDYGQSMPIGVIATAAIPQIGGVQRCMVWV